MEILIWGLYHSKAMTFDIFSVYILCFGKLPFCHGYYTDNYTVKIILNVLFDLNRMYSMMSVDELFSNNLILK